MILPKMKIILLGYNHIIESVAKHFLEQKIDVKIITNQNQGKNALDLFKVGITHLCKSKTELLELLKSFKLADNDISISVGCPWILNSEHIRALKNNAYNLHGTQLPKYRGGTIYTWQILTRNRIGMCLLHKLEVGIDSGHIVDYEEFIYPPNCHKPVDYIQYHNQKNICFTKNALDKLLQANNQLVEIQQPEYLSSYWPRLRADVHGWIDWSWDVYELERFICAFDDPYAGARCKLNGEIVILKDTYAQATDGYTHPFQNGLIYRNNGKWINVAVNGGELLICSITDKDCNNIIQEVKEGDRFFSTPEDLLATRKRVIKTKKGLSVKEFRSE